MDKLRERLPAQRQAKLLREHGLGAEGTEQHGISGLSEMARQELPWYRVASRRKLYFLLFPGAIVTYATSGYDGSMMNSLQTVSHWDDYFDNPRGAVLGLMSAIMALGSICSTPIAPWVADKFGRRVGITTGSLIMIAGAIMQCESHNFDMFVASRFLLGFGLTFCTTAAPSLVSELSHPKERVVVTSICNTCWNLGSICAAWITFGTRRIDSSWSWRIPSLLQLLPSVLQLAIIWFLPESPRWLISKDRNDEALATLKRYHGDGEETPLVRLEYEEICAAIRHEKESGQASWKSLVSTPGNRSRIFLVICMGTFSQWSGNGLVSYYLSRIMDSIGMTDGNIQALVNGIMALWTWGLSLTAAFFVERIGRRPLFLFSTVSMLIVFICWTAASAVFAERGTEAAAIGVLVLVFVFSSCYCVAYGPLPVAYSVEVLPFTIRAKGMATYVFTTKAAVFVNQYVNPIGMRNIGWKYYLVYVVILAIESFIAWGWFVETKGKTLEEIAVIFDGAEAIEVINQAKIEGIAEIELCENAKVKV